MALAVNLAWERQYRIIPSAYPPINFFEGLVDPSLMDELFFIESLTNSRLRQEVGDISMVPPADRLSGAGSTPVMAAFTHIGVASRFSNGSYGIYYAAKDLDTAFAETVHSRARFLSYTQEEAGEVDMRVYVGKVIKPLHDVRSHEFDHLHLPDDWTHAQNFGRQKKVENSWGIVFRSVRHVGGECIAVLRPPAVSIPQQGAHYAYVWDGRRITRVYEKVLTKLM